MSKLQTLISARELIKTDWWDGKGHDKDGIGNGTLCALSAIMQFAYGIEACGAVACAMGLDQILGEKGIPGWNDTHSHAEVLAAFDRAITVARLEQTPTMDDRTDGKPATRPRVKVMGP